MKEWLKEHKIFVIIIVAVIAFLGLIIYLAVTAGGGARSPSETERFLSAILGRDAGAIMHTAFGFFGVTAVLLLFLANQGLWLSLLNAVRLLGCALMIGACFNFGANNDMNLALAIGTAGLVAVIIPSVIILARPRKIIREPSKTLKQLMSRVTELEERLNAESPTD